MTTSPPPSPRSRLDAEALFRKYSKRVHWYLVVLGARDAEDEAQEVFLTAHRLGGFVPGTAQQPLSWLLKIAFNVRRDGRRTLRRRPMNLDEEAVDGAITAAPGPEDAAATRQTMTWLQRALDGLSPELRDVLVLCEILDKPRQEVAEFLDVPLGTVHSRLNGAKNAITAAYRCWEEKLPRERRSKALRGRLRNNMRIRRGNASVRLADDPRVPARLRADLRRARHESSVHYDVNREHARFMAILGTGVDPTHGSDSTGGGQSAGAPAGQAASSTAAQGGVVAGVAKIVGASSILQGTLVGAMAGVVMGTGILVTPLFEPAMTRMPPSNEPAGAAFTLALEPEPEPEPELDPQNVSYRASPLPSSSVQPSNLPPKATAARSDLPEERVELAPADLVPAPPEQPRAPSVPAASSVLSRGGDLHLETQITRTFRERVDTDPQSVLAAIDAVRFPHPQFRREREEIAIRALRKLGREAEARARLQALEAPSPVSASSPGVRPASPGVSSEGGR